MVIVEKPESDRMIAALCITLVLILVAISLTIQSSAKTELGLKISDFEMPIICGGCHDSHYSEWQQSQHAQAQVDQLYLSEYEQASKDTAGLTDPFCEKCHSPISYMAGEVPVTSDIGKKGISCDFCHTVSNATGIGNGAFYNSPGKIKRGPLSDAVSTYHQTEYSELHTKAEFCAMCHVVNHPVNNLPIMTTYQEWSRGPYAAQGITCQHCMMVPSEGKDAITGPDRKEVFGHIFYGGHFDYNLKKAATLALGIMSPTNLGENVTVEANVTNSGCGHYLPTGVTEIRQVWLEVSTNDSSGRPLFSGRQYYRQILVDANGQDVGALFWKATRVLSDNRIAPQETRSEKFSFKIPNNATLPIMVEAKLLYRLAPQEVADKAGVGTLPTITLAQTEVTSGGMNFLNKYSLPVGIVAILAIVIISLTVIRRRRK